MVFQSVGSSILLPTSLDNITDADIAVNSSGDYVVVWQDTRTSSSSYPSDIYFQRFNADGTTKDANPRFIAGSGSLSEINPKVAIADDGGFVVTYSQPVSGRNKIISSRHDAAGNQIGNEILRTSDGFNNYESDIAMYSNGDFVIVSRPYSSNNHLTLDFYRKDGTLEKQLTLPFTGGNNFSVDVTPVKKIGSTSIVVSFQGGGANQVLYQRLDSDGTLLGSVMATHSPAPSIPPDHSLAVDAAGNFTIAWSEKSSAVSGDYQYNVFLRQIYADGSARTASAVLVDTATYQPQVSIAMADDGRFVIAHSDAGTGKSELREYSANGSLVDNGKILGSASISDGALAAAVSPNGKYMAFLADDGAFQVNARIQTFTDPSIVSPTIQFSQATPYQINEGAGTSNLITLTRSGLTSNISEVQLNITGGTAIAGADYSNTGLPLTVNFAAGETSKTVAIPIAQDALVEETETITFSIASLSNAAIGTTSTATLQILDDDANPDKTVNPGKTNDRLIGDTSANTLVGGAGDDFLWGKGGKDRLTGGDGRDQFIFDINTRFNKQVMGVDVITDFIRGVDTIVLDRTTFTKLKGSKIRPIDFASVKTAIQAKQSKALITYVRSTGSLFYNENRAKPGFGEGGQFADLTNGLPLSRLHILLQP